jgi:hypothetical protein
MTEIVHEIDNFDETTNICTDSIEKYEVIINSNNDSDSDNINITNNLVEQNNEQNNDKQNEKLSEKELQIKHFNIKEYICPHNKLYILDRVKIIKNKIRNPYKYLNNIIYINLLNRPDRSIKCIKQLINIGYNNIMRFDAIPLGFKGCLLSHLGCILYAKYTDLEWITICEDDIFIRNYGLLINQLKVLEKTNTNFNIIFNGITTIKPAKRCNSFLCYIPDETYGSTFVIVNKKYYDRFGYIYQPEYKSVWCDNEFMEIGNLLGKQVYIDNVIIKHEHPDWGYGKRDFIHTTNLNNLSHDESLYRRRKENNFYIN